MALTRQQKWYAYQRNLKQQRSSGASGGGAPSYSAAAQAVIDSFPVEPTSAEQDKIATFVDAETTAGNWAKYDSFALFTLSNEQNALWDWIQLQSMTAVNAPTHGANGYTFDGSTQYINSNFIPSTDKINLSLNDAEYGAYIQAQNTGSVDILFGALAATAGHRVYIYESPLDTRFSGTMHSGDTNSGGTEGGFKDNTLTYVSRDGATSSDIYENGSVVASWDAVTSVGIPDIALFLACYNNQGSPGSHLDCTLSTWYAGAVLADNATHYTNIQTLLA